MDELEIVISRIILENWQLQLIPRREKHGTLRNLGVTTSMLTKMLKATL